LIVSKDGRELQENSLEYGSLLLVQDGQEIKKGTRLAEWDANNKVLLTEKGGKIEFVDVIENITIQERFDEATGVSNYVVLDRKGEKYQPAVSILDENNEEVAQYYLPAGSFLGVKDGQMVVPGDVLVKMPREVTKTKDITGGLPRIAELFEARMSKDPAIISDIDGEVVFAGLHRGMRKISVVSGAESYDYLVPRGKQLNVVNGERVSAGDLITTGIPVLHDMLRILGPEVVQKYLVDNIQEIYLLQGIKINDRHIEVIVRQMMRKVRIVDSGDSDFLVGDRVDKVHFKNVNSLLKAEGKKVATAKPILMGITTASLDTESFISAASFQETTRILSEAAISGQIDCLNGLKENVIVGKLIPAGTGIESFRNKYLGDDISSLELQARREEEKEIARQLNK
jgi:DNA-directed RNA polymerase subunit beta'